MMNVLNRLPKASQEKVKSKLHDIWQAEKKEDAEIAFDNFVRSYKDKFPKVSENLEKDRTELLAFYAFPALQWQSIRTSNPI